MTKPSSLTSSTLERRMLLGASAFALLLSPMAATAQVNETGVNGDLAATDDIRPGAVIDVPGDDEIVVTGIRASIAEALDLKRDSSSIIEAITSEDIGKLPDISIADSLARLPGITAQRVRGRAQGISIRGLGPDFSIALLNGREIVSAGNNRGIEFDQFPSELIGQGVVYKSPTARLAATGIAGTVDLRTVKPLDYADDQVNVSAKYVYNDNGQLNPDFGDDGYRLFGSYIGVNDSGTAGFTLAVTTQSNPTQFLSRELKAEAPFQVTTNDDGVTFASDNPRTGVVSRDFKRTSIAGSLQFEPTDRFRASADVLYSDYSDEGIFRGVETPLASWSGNSATDIQAGPTGFASSVTYPLTPVILRTDTESNEVKSSAFGVNVAYDLTERLTVAADISTSSLDRNDIDYESYAGTGRGIVGSGNEDALSSLTFLTPENGAYSVVDGRGIDYTDPGTVSLTDPGGWGQVGFIREPIVEDDLDQIRLEASYDLETPFISDVTAGVLFTDRFKNFDDNPRFLRPGLGFDDSTQAIPNGIILGETDAGSTGLPIIAYDPDGLLTDGTYIQEATGGNAFTVEEEITTAYAMANLETQLGDMPVRGNIGIQYVDTDQGSAADFAIGGSDPQRTFIGDSYDYWLPSVNLNFELMDDLNLRLGFAKTATRPLFNDLGGGFGFGFNTTVCEDTNMDQIPDVLLPNTDASQTCFSGGGGNPLLRPYRSDAYDISAEKYFGPSSAIVVAGFYKDLSDYVQGDSDFVDGTDLIELYGAGDFLAANPSVSTIRINGPVNTESGEIYGIEGTIRLAFEDIMGGGFARGFGFNGSYGYTEAEVLREFDDGTTDAIDIPGYSKQVGSGEVYYENNGFRARVSANYRSRYRAEVFLFDGTAFGARAKGRTTVDGQIGYEFQEGALEGLSLNVEAYNLTDEPFRTEVDFNQDGDFFVSRREDYGRTFNVTVAQKF